MEKCFSRIRFLLDKIVIYIAATLFMLAVFLTAFATINRALELGIKTIWAEEFAIAGMAWATLLLIGHLLRRGMHTQLTMLHDRLPDKAKHVHTTILLLVELAFFCFVAVGGCITVVQSARMTSVTLGISLSYVYVCLPIGCLVCIIEIIMLLGEELKALFQKNTEKEIKTGGETT